MSLRNTVYSTLIADSSLSTLVGTNVYYNILPLNYSSPKAVIFNLQTNETFRDLLGNVIYKDKNCNIKAVSTRLDSIYDIADVVYNIIENSLEYSDLETDDEPFYDDERKLFTLNIDFRIKDF